VAAGGGAGRRVAQRQPHRRRTVGASALARRPRGAVQGGRAAAPVPVGKDLLRDPPPEAALGGAGAVSVLKHLRITNFAILSDVEIELGAGFNVLTGETGAGKSLIVDAVALLRGGRASADIPRAGADEAVVEAVFEPPDDLRAELDARLERAGLR